MKLGVRLFSSIPKSVWAAVLFSLVVHVAGLYIIATGIGHDALLWGDAQNYVKLAIQLSEGNGFVYEFEGQLYPELFRTPGLPFLMSLFLTGGTVSFVYFFIITILSSLIIPLTLYYIGRELFNKGVGIITAWLYVLEPLTTFSSWFGHTEGPFMIVMTSAVATLVYAYKHKNLFAAVCAGVLIALSLYIRPVILIIYIVALISLIAYSFYRSNRNWHFSAITLLVMFILLFPWMSHVKAQSDVFTLTASGWRNVYTDYVASIRAVQNKTNFKFEKNNLRDYAESEFGFTRVELNHPSSSGVLKDYSLNVIFNNLDTVIKMETGLLFSYFTNTSYQLYLGMTGIIPKIERIISPTHILLSKGIGGIGEVYNEMKRVYFLPVIERVWSLSILLLALLGVWLSRKRPITYLLVLIIVVGALTSTAIGFGVEGRMRVPILPFYFMFAAVSLQLLYSYAKNKFS